MKLFTTLILALFFSSLLMAQNFAVTFQVDMTNETVSADGVSIAGNFQAAAGGTDWIPGDLFLTDGDNDNIYEVTVMIPAGTYQYKFLNGNVWGTEEGVPGACAVSNNREVEIAAATAIPPVCFATCDATCSVVLPPVAVTFQVDLSNVIASDSVCIAGNVQGAAGFTDWTPGETLLADQGNGIWSVTLMIPPGTYQYKFLNGSAWGFEEGVPCSCAVSGNREVTIPNAATVLDAVCFGTCEEVCPSLTPFNITFRVDMSAEIPSASGIHVAGDFTDPKWVKDGIDLLDGDGDGIYESAPVTITQGEYQYKFVNGTTDADEETADFLGMGCGCASAVGGSNRILDLTSNTQDIVWDIDVYNSCATRVGTRDQNTLAPFMATPNPFNNSTIIEFENRQNQNFQLRVANVTGQIVREMNNVSGTQVVLEREGLPAGIYLVTLRNEDGRFVTKKLAIN